MSSMEGHMWDEGGDFGAFIARVGTELLPKMKKADATIMIVPAVETDAKFAVELGLAIMLQKPIILLVRPGLKVPAKLAQIADDIVEINLERPAALQAAVLASMDRLAKKGKL